MEKVVLSGINENGNTEDLEVEVIVGLSGLISVYIESNFVSLNLTPMSNLTSLQSLNISGIRNLTSLELTPLSNLTSLQSLTISGSRSLTSLELTPVGELTNLQELRLTGNQIQNDIDLSPLSSCTNLGELILERNQLQSIDLSSLSSCTSLWRLVLSNNQLQNIDLSPLSSCTSLRNLDLSNTPIQNIDLSPLSLCTNLRQLFLGRNQLQSIDLMPLNSCVELLNLLLGDNQLNNIDLSPLSLCTNLRQLILERNQLQSIDLTPLSSCVELTNLLLGDNQLKKIDLSPLRYCTGFKTKPSSGQLFLIDLSSNQLKSIDLTPLNLGQGYGVVQVLLNGNSFQSVEVTPLNVRQRIGDPDYTMTSWLPIATDDIEFHAISYSHPAHLYPWSFLHYISNDRVNKNDYRVQYEIRGALGLADYGFLDCDLTDIFNSIPPETTIKDAQEIMTEHLVEEIVAAVDRGGPTTGLNLEKLSHKHGEIATLFQNIVDLRRKEIERITIPKRGSKYDLRELWLTAHGYEICSQFDLRLTIKKKTIMQVMSAFTELGIKLKIGESSISGVVMSDELRECIWWIAENRGKSWNSIEGLEGW